MKIYKDIRSFIKIPDYITLMGLVCSLTSIFYSLKKEFLIATIFILSSTIFDYFDGKAARKINRQCNFGKELDNLCDVILYLISIVIFGYMVGLDNMLSFIVFIIFVMSGVIRLARFALLGIEDGYYRGLPVSFSIIIPLVYFIFTYYNINIIHLLWFYFIPSFLMISTIKVKKQVSRYFINK
jgi:CDP-diacylglycerol---serine O-phosphatidyltransferase